MKIQKIFQYAYFVFAILFLYDGINRWADDRTRAYTSLGLAVLAIFMFFFRKRFNKKFEDRNNK